MALNKVINNVQSKRSDGIKGEFTCYSGLALPMETIELWKEKSYLSIDGFRSTSLKESIATSFSVSSETNELDKVILRIKIENKKGNHYMHLDRKDFTMYPKEEEVLL